MRVRFLRSECERFSIICKDWALEPEGHGLSPAVDKRKQLDIEEMLSCLNDRAILKNNVIAFSPYCECY